MSDESGIEWLRDAITGVLGATWNPVSGCRQIPGVRGRPSGCDECYAKRLLDTRHAKIASSPRFGLPFEHVLTHANRLWKPVQWRRSRRIFVNSLSDLFHVDVPDEFIRQVFAVMQLAEQHTFLLLTKRAERMRRFLQTETLGSILAAQPRALRAYLEAIGVDDVDATAERVLRRVRAQRRGALRWPLPNVHAGVSISTADDHHRAVELTHTPNALPWYSLEPLLGSLSAVPFEDYRPAWIVAGGESGPNARPMHPAWVREIRDRCVAAGIPFFFKQWGEYAPADDGDAEGRGPIRPLVRLGNDFVGRFGKKRAGRVLDGRTWDEYPAVALGATA